MSEHYKDQKISDWVIEHNNQYVLFSKPVGMPVQKDLTPETDLLTLASIYTKSTLYLVNRVDRPASGLVLVAKSPESATNLSEYLSKQEGKKEYLVIVEKAADITSDTIVSYLKKGRNNKAVVSDVEKEGFKKAELSYEVKQQFDNYTLITVVINTGRFHQIRAQLASKGLHIKGDVKYGARRKNKDRSIALHAWKMTIKHPISGEVKHFKAPLPGNDVLWGAVSIT